MSVTLHVWVSIHHMIVFFVAQVQNDDTSRYFFHFFKIVVFWVVRRVGVKRQKIAQNDKKIPSNSVSQKLYFIWLWLLVHMCKMVISAAIFFFFFFFSFFQNSDFSGFSKFINKCQKEILRCALPSSHVRELFNNVKYVKLWIKWKLKHVWSSCLI